MNFVTSVFKKYINKNDAKQTHQAKGTSDETVECSNILTANKNNAIKNDPTFQRPTQSHSRIFEEDEPFEDAQSSPENARMEPQIEGPTINIRRSSSIQSDSLNGSMTDSLEITIPEASNALEDSIEKSECLKPNDDIEEYQSLSPMIVLDSQHNSVSLIDILKPKNVESSQSSLEVLIKHVNKTLAINEDVKEVVDFSVTADRVEQSLSDVRDEKEEASGLPSVDDLLVELTTCTLQNEINDTEELKNKITKDDKSDFLISLEVPSLRQITSSVIKKSKFQRNIIEKQSLEASILKKSNKEVMFKNPENKKSTENCDDSKKNELNMINKSSNQNLNANIEHIPKGIQKMHKECLKTDRGSLLVSSSCIDNENKKGKNNNCPEIMDIKVTKNGDSGEQNENIVTKCSDNLSKESEKRIKRDEKNTSKQPDSQESGILQVNRNSLVDFERLEKQYTEQVENEHILLTKVKIQDQNEVLEKKENEYKKAHKYENAITNDPDIIHKSQKITLQKEYAGNIEENIAKDMVQSDEELHKELEKIKCEIPIGITLEINSILNDIVEESQQKVIQRFDIVQRVDGIEIQNNPADATEKKIQAMKPQHTECYQDEHSNKLNDKAKEFVTESKLLQNIDDQSEQYEIYSRQETLEFEKLEKQMDDISEDKENISKESQEPISVVFDIEKSNSEIIETDAKSDKTNILEDLVAESVGNTVESSINNDININKETHQGIYKRQDTLEFERLENKFEDSSSSKKNNDILEEITTGNVVENKVPDNTKESQTSTTEERKSIKPSNCNNLATNILYSAEENLELQQSSKNINSTEVINNILEELVAESVGTNIDSSQNNNDLNGIEEFQIDQHGIYKRQETLEFEKLEKKFEHSPSIQKINDILEEIVTESCTPSETPQPEKEFDESFLTDTLRPAALENPKNETQTSACVGNTNNRSSKENSKTLEEELFLQKEPILPINMSASTSYNTKERLNLKKEEPGTNASNIRPPNDLILSENVIHSIYKRQETLEFEKLENKLADAYQIENVCTEGNSPLNSSNKMETNSDRSISANKETDVHPVTSSYKGEHPSMPFSHANNNLNNKDTLKHDLPTPSGSEAKTELCSNIVIISPKFKQGSPKKFVNKVEVRPNIRNKSKSSVSIELVKPKEQVFENDELRNKIDTLQEELESLKKRRGNKSELEIESNKNVVNKYREILEEYENHIAQQTKDLAQLRMESEINMRHFTNTEMAFSDVFEKYEKAKGVIAIYKKNEETLSENLKNAGEQLYQLEAKCSTMKQQSMEFIQKANEQIEEEKRRYQQDIGKLQAQVKRLEIKASSLEVALKQKTDECQALATLCDDITGRNPT